VTSIRSTGRRLTAVELGIGKEAHKVRRIPRLHMVPLEMQRDVFEGARISVNVEGLDGRTWVFAPFLCLLYLALEVLREV
jgi:hypothetical protein